MEKEVKTVAEKFAAVPRSGSGPDNTQWDQLCEFVGHLTAGNVDRLKKLIK